jgi:hypothetical protein
MPSRSFSETKEAYTQQHAFNARPETDMPPQYGWHVNERQGLAEMPVTSMNAVHERPRWEAVGARRAERGGDGTGEENIFEGG